MIRPHFFKTRVLLVWGLAPCFLVFLLAAEPESIEIPEKSGFIGPVKIQSTRGGAAANAEPNKPAPLPLQVTIPSTTPPAAQNSEDTVEPEFPKEFRDFWKQECHHFFSTSAEYGDYKNCYDHLLQKAREYQEEHYSLEEFNTDEQLEVFVHTNTLNRLEEKERKRNKTLLLSKKEASAKNSDRERLVSRIEAELDDISVEESSAILPSAEKVAGENRAASSSKNRPLIEIEEVDLNKKSGVTNNPVAPIVSNPEIKKNK